MASSSIYQIFLLFSCFFFLSNILEVQSFDDELLPSSIVFPIIKDVSTLQYITTIHHGSPLAPIKLVVDLGGPLIWVDCASGLVSLSRRVIPNQSIQCSRTGTGAARDVGGKACDVFPENGNIGLASRGELVEDTIALRSADGSKLDPLITTVDQFLFSCAPASLLQGLASGVKGMLGLGRGPISLPSQLATAVGHHRRFFMCLSSSNGLIFSHSNRPKDSIFGTETTKSLMYTPLGGSSQDYFINVKSIKIGSNQLLLGDKGMTKLSTNVPYTTMESSIYATFTEAYKSAAGSRNMTAVEPVVPFGLCFSSKGIDESLVPVIDLVLQSEMVKWRIHGANSMVRVNQEVMCLGFLDGGSELTSSIVLGGAQLEENLLEFDLGTSMLGFRSLRPTSCSIFAADFMLQESL
ncbi:probable aspartic proteinase GIP2 [Pistacia vera]|uniref:probable aspartic proteinase GIP2 n=1 Tax=Pistacia vera TaxID=55513 RepID=UPI001263A3EE|nr:probable aspartic proteinase GIP2 [Pistacia vera]